MERNRLQILSRIFLTVFGLFIFFGCVEEDCERIEHTAKTYADGQKKVIIIYELCGEESVPAAKKHLAENGTVLMQGGLAPNGDRDSKWEAFFPNGKLRSVMHYKNGIKHGKSEVYYPNGQLNYSGKYKNGDRSGTWRYYDEQGNELKSQKF